MLCDSPAAWWAKTRCMCESGGCILWTWHCTGPSTSWREVPLVPCSSVLPTGTVEGRPLPAASGIPPGECCLLLEAGAMCLGTNQPIYRWVSRSQAANQQTGQLPSWHSSAQLCSSLELNPSPCFTHVEGVLHTGGCSARRAPCTVATCRGIVPRHAEPTISSSESPEESPQNIKPGEKEQTPGANGEGTKKDQDLTRTKLAGNQPSLSRILPHHHSLLVASITSMTSPALNPSSWSSMVTWSQRASAYTTLPSLMSCGQSRSDCQSPTTAAPCW